MEQTLEPAFIRVKQNRPKREKKPKEIKPKQVIALKVEKSPPKINQEIYLSGENLGKFRDFDQKFNIKSKKNSEIYNFYNLM